jgi:hypothetical protein
MPQQVPAPPAAHALAQQLLAYEATNGTPAEPVGQAAVRVCAELRVVVSRFAGGAGFHSLLGRALALAQRDDPWLAAVTVTAEGALTGFAEAAQGQDPAAVTAGGQALLGHFLGLLHTFIGDALTLRLLTDGWPDASFDVAPPGRQETIQ